MRLRDEPDFLVPSEVLDCLDEQGRVVVALSDHVVAVGAEKATNSPRRVVMIDREESLVWVAVLVRCVAAYCALAVLLGQHLLVHLFSEAVFLQLVLALGFDGIPHEAEVRCAGFGVLWVGGAASAVPPEFPSKEFPAAIAAEVMDAFHLRLILSRVSRMARLIASARVVRQYVASASRSFRSDSPSLTGSVERLFCSMGLAYV